MRRREGHARSIQINAKSHISLFCSLRMGKSVFQKKKKSIRSPSQVSRKPLAILKSSGGTRNKNSKRRACTRLSVRQNERVRKKESEVRASLPAGIRFDVRPVEDVERGADVARAFFDDVVRPIHLSR